MIDTVTPTNLQKLLPYVLQHDNIARIDGQHLLIGKRNTYPLNKGFLSCSTVYDVHAAIKSMVTQGGGPLEVGLRWLQLRSQTCSMDTLRQEAGIIASARPTNTTMARTMDKALDCLDPGMVSKRVDDLLFDFDWMYIKMGNLGAKLINDSDTLLTTCFPEHSFLLSLIIARIQGKKNRVIVPETRPYLQGARLTAPSLDQIGIDVNLICDNMSAAFFSHGDIQLYMTASDRVLVDNTVINKIGTLQNAIMADKFHVPYYAFSVTPDFKTSNVEIEFREGDEITRFGGMKVTEDGLSDKYPAFDIIEPHLVSGVISPEGIRYTKGETV